MNKVSKSGAIVRISTVVQIFENAAAFGLSRKKSSLQTADFEY